MCAVAGSMIFLNGPAFCENKETKEEPIKYRIGSDFFTKYIWRGQNLTNGAVWQPYVAISKSGFTGSVWGNLDMTKTNNHAGEFTEFDYSLDYSGNMPNISWLNYSAGVIHYEFPGTVFHPTTEVYGGLGLNTFLLPVIKAYRDVGEIDGTYIQLSIGHIVEKVVEWKDDCYCSAQFGMSFGYGDSQYNKGYFDAEGGGMNDWTMSFALPVCMGSWTFKPSINYSMMLDDNVRDNTLHSDNIWTGISITRYF